MATKLITALGVPVALLALVLVLLASAGSPAAPPAEDSGTGSRWGSWDRADAVARLKDAQGDFVGVVRFRYEGDEVEVEADVKNVDVNPGQFHGFHVHTTGVCDPESVDPATGSPFFSAGGHFNSGGDPHGDHAGDFPVLLVQSDGHAEEEFDTDRFGLRQLFDRDGSAVIVHEGRDNYANIPDRYSSPAQPGGGPDAATLATGDAGARFACGVVRRP